MMKATGTASVTAFLLITACGDKPSEPMSKAEVKAVVEKVQLKPGQWDGSVIVEDIDMSSMPGMPAGAAEQMKSAMSQTSIKYCITPEQAANPSGSMFAGQANKDCTYQGFAVSGGTVKGQVSCKAPSGTMTVNMTGTYGGEAYAIAMDMKMAGGPQGTTMAMKARSKGKWIGPTCTTPTPK